MADPHPITGAFFDSPVPPGTGWPDDPATVTTPVARSAADVARLAGASSDLVTLDARITVCRACDRLVAWREEVARTGRRASFAHEPYWGRPAPSTGDPDAPILIVGLAPAANGANRTGRMFTGDRSGDWLWSALHRAGMARRECSTATGDGQALLTARMGATVRCAPPANKPTAEERSTCSAYLVREIELMKNLKVFLALGGIAWNATLSAVKAAGWRVPRPKPRFGHGAEATVASHDGRDVTLLGCYHPSQQNTFTGRLTRSMLDDVLAEARRLAAG